MPTFYGVSLPSEACVLLVIMNSMPQRLSEIQEIILSEQAEPFGLSRRVFPISAKRSPNGNKILEDGLQILQNNPDAIKRTLLSLAKQGFVYTDGTTYRILEIGLVFAAEIVRQHSAIPDEELGKYREVISPLQRNYQFIHDDNRSAPSQKESRQRTTERKRIAEEILRRYPNLAKPKTRR